MFQLMGYPCCHAIATINYHRLNVEDYVDIFLKKETYLKVYSHMINPVLGMHDFEESTLGKVAPPSVKSKIPAPNSQNPFSQSEPLFLLDEIPQAPQLASTQASQSRTNELSQSQTEPLFPLHKIAQTSQFMASTQASQTRTNEVNKAILYSTYSINVPTFVSPRSTQFSSPFQVTRPEPTDIDPKTADIAQWTERDQIVREAILSTLSNTLFDVYCCDSYTAESLWDELDRKCNTEEQGLEKYSVSKFTRYQMVEDRSVAEQTYEIINLEYALADAEMKLLEKFLAITEKTVSMGNSSTAEVLGIGSVDLKFPSGRILSLKRVHHVPIVRRNIISEDVFPKKTRIPSSVSLDDSLASTSIPEHVEKMTNVGVNPNSTSLTHEESNIPRQSKRARVVKDFGSDFVTYNIEDDPVTFKDVMASSEAKQWKEAVKSEMNGC
ncbi:UNVERIFIED_CONTAM: hypothetical protein Scaly_1027300 [Sesamum calycinum]|uniref:Retrovirus-related Pol polyprotein from transposon TNT 1-94-like beta-barrel domain-containing protein n=1 Tax=Sesamum calycinum TaxID=2727403 RepID=A0AAW2QJK2_9LAMI